MGSSRIGCLQEQVTGLLQAILNDLERTQGPLRQHEEDSLAYTVGGGRQHCPPNFTG